MIVFDCFLKFFLQHEFPMITSNPLFLFQLSPSILMENKLKIIIFQLRNFFCATVKKRRGTTFLPFEAKNTDLLTARAGQ